MLLHLIQHIVDITPIQLLEKELRDYKRSFEKSNELFEKGEITKELNDKHWRNLMPIISEYEQAIKKLKQ